MEPQGQQGTVSLKHVTACRFRLPPTLYLLLLLSGWCSGTDLWATDGGTPIRMAITTSIRDSGLLEAVQPELERLARCRLDVIAVGSGAALELARRGDVEVVLSHSPQAERTLVEQGIISTRIPILRNEFRLVGPPADPLRIDGLSPVDAYRRVVSSGVQEIYLSRGDDSGTHKKEQAVLQTAGLEPGATFLVTGRGMGATLTMASELQAYTLTDRGTWLSRAEQLNLRELVVGGQGFENPYHLLLTRAAETGARRDTATRIVEAFFHPDVIGKITQLKIHGRPLFDLAGVAVPEDSSSTVRKADRDPPKAERGLLAEIIPEAIGMLLGGDRAIYAAALRTLLISVLAVTAASAVSLPIAALISEANPRIQVFCRAAAQGLLAVPTVLIGLLGFALLSRSGPLGSLELLYTPTAIVAGEICLAAPILVSTTLAAILSVPPAIRESARLLGAGFLRRAVVNLRETREIVIQGHFTAFGRCATELGIAMMIGGNLPHRTKTLTTAIAVESARGEFARGIAMGILLLAVAMLVIVGTRIYPLHSPAAKQSNPVALP